MKFFFALWALTFFTTGLAKEITIEEDSLGGVSLYRCNAGLKSTELADHISVRTQQWNDVETDWAAPGPVLSLAAGFENFAKVVNPAYQFQTTLRGLTFQLNSAKTSSTLFIDTCYDGPQIQYFSENLAEEVKANLSVYSEMTIAALDPNTGNTDAGRSSYLAVAKPEIRTSVACDKQGEGAFKNAEDKGIDIDFEAFDKGTQGGSDFFVSSGGFTPIRANTMVGLTNEWIALQSSHMARFCVIRHEIRETTGADRTRLHSPRFLVFSRIEEPEMN